MVLRVNQIKAVKPEKIFLMAGINGLDKQDINEFTEKYQTLVDSIKTCCPAAKIYLQSILPVNPTMKYGKFFNKGKILECNNIIKRIAKRKGCVYMNLYKLYAVNDIMPKELTKDGVHLRPYAYDRWADEISIYIYEGKEKQ